MEGKYEILICADCKEEFTFTAEAELYFLKRGFRDKPKRCKACYRKAQEEEEES